MRCRTLRYRRAWFRAMGAIGPMIDHSLRSAKTSHTTARSHATSYTHSYQAPERLTNPTICVSTHSKCTISEVPRSDPLPSSLPNLTHDSLCIELFIFLKKIKKICNPISQKHPFLTYSLTFQFAFPFPSKVKMTKNPKNNKCIIYGHINKGFFE